MKPVPLEDLETFTTTFLICRTIIEIGLPSLTAFFTGPWSDKFGRKPVILSSAFGNFIRCAMYMVVINYPTLNPWYYLVCSIPYCLFGGSAYLLLGTYCYISDLSSDEVRTTRFVIVQCVFILGTVAGIQFATHLSYPAVFAIAAGLTFTAYSFAKHALPESILHRTIINLEGVNPLSFKYIRYLKNICYTQQTPKNRIRTLLIMLILLIALFTELGDDGIMYIFLKEKLDIEVSSYATYMTVILCVGILEVNLVNYIFTSTLNVATLNLLFLAVFMKLLGVFATLVGYRLWHFGFDRTLNGFIILITALSRSYLSALVPEEHLGKIFGLLIPVESWTQVFASPLYVEIFNRTTARMTGGLPEAVFILSTLLMLFDLILVIILMKLSRNEETGAGPDQFSPEMPNTTRD